MTAAELIFTTRIKLGLEISEVSKRTGIPPQAISNHERGENITEKTLRRYAQAFGAEKVDVRFVFKAKQQ